ncbi:reverse transcriptase domain-containing protein [Tanacetum coccineum]
MNTRARQEGKVPCSRDSKAKDGAHPCTPIAVRKAQGTRKITLKAKIVREGTRNLNHEERSPVSKMTISPNLGQQQKRRDNYNDLREAFLKNYLQQKKCIRDPIVLHNIKQRDGESTEDFIQRYKSESGNVKGAPECMRISGFVHGITNPELIKRFHEKIPKTVDEMMQVATSFLQGQKATSNQESKKAPPAWKHQEGGHRQNFKKWEASAANISKRKGRTGVAHNPGAEAKQRKRPAEKERRNLRKRETSGNSNDSVTTKGPLIIKAKIGGHQMHRICIDGWSSFEILYEHCFNRLRPEIKNQMVPATTSLIGFSGEIKWPLGQITLLVKIGDDEHSTSAWMDFMVVRSTSPHNGIIGRPGLRKIQAVPSTTHGMIKFPVTGGILTLKSSKIIPVECAMVSGPEEQPISVNKVREERVKVAINPEHPEQTGAFTAYSEHRLNVREGCQPVRQKKRGQAAERNIAINDEVSKLVAVWVYEEFYYMIGSPIPVMVKEE